MDPPSDRRPHQRKRALVAVGILALLAAGAAFGFVALRGGDHAGDRFALTWSPSHIEQQDQDAIQTGLVSQDQAAFVATLDPAIQSAFDSSALLPAGSILKLDPSTFQTTGRGIARVEATVEGPEHGRWMIYLHQVDGRWRVLGTDGLG